VHRVLAKLASRNRFLLLALCVVCFWLIVRGQSEVNVPKVLTIDRPLVLPVMMSSDVETALSLLSSDNLSASGAVDLEIRCEPTTRRDAPNVRVFLNHPSATQKTPIEDPHYVSSFAIYPSPSIADSSEGMLDFVMDATKTLNRLAQMGDFHIGSPLTVTLVATPPRPSSKVTASLSIREVALKRRPALH
jgi:hypothetical protein